MKMGHKSELFCSRGSKMLLTLYAALLLWRIDCVVESTKGTALSLFCVFTIAYASIEGLNKKVLSKCDWPADAKCNQKRESEPNLASVLCAAPGSEGVLVAHENCNQFYKCSSGKPVAFNCPLNLLYNANKEYCDWPRNVECGERLIPENDESSTDNNVTGSEGNNENNEVDEVTSGEGSEDTGITGNGDPSQAPVICNSANSDGVLIAHENCNQFYKCSGRHPVALYCPGILLFNPNVNSCDWPHNVECGDRFIADSNNGENDSDSIENETDKIEEGAVDDHSDPPLQAPYTCDVHGSESILVAHENCNQFYKCHNGLPIALMCPGNLLYNPSKQYCDWPANVECGERVIPDSDDNTIDSGSTENSTGADNESNETGNNNSDPTQASIICAAQNSDGLLIAHENCNQFYKCSEGLPVALMCPGNLLYNPSKQYCDWPANVECGERLIPDSDDNTIDSGSTENSTGADNESNETGNNNSDPTQASIICAAQNSDGLLIAHKNCNQFYKCSEGLPVALMCPGNLLYNPSKQYCDWPANVECGERVIPDNDDNTIDSGSTENSTGADNESNETGNNNSDPTQASIICAAQNSDGLLIAHENCNQFYKCSEGLPVALMCPGNLLYNPSKQYCDWPANVECGERLIPDSDNNTTDSGSTENSTEADNESNETGNNNSDPTLASIICAAQNSDGLLIAHENCNQFYKCSEGKPVVLSCQLNLLYNSKKEYCDWPYNVDCNGRVIPSTIVAA